MHFILLFELMLKFLDNAILFQIIVLIQVIVATIFYFRGSQSGLRFDYCVQVLYAISVMPVLICPSSLVLYIT